MVCDEVEPINGQHLITSLQLAKNLTLIEVNLVQRNL